MLAERGKFIGEAQVQGSLYDFGRYPGARPSSQSITGEIFEIDDSLLATFDEYEGPEYERVTVKTSHGGNCWIYWYVGPDSGRRIASGDWFKR